MPTKKNQGQNQRAIFLKSEEFIERLLTLHMLHTFGKLGIVGDVRHCRTLEVNKGSSRSRSHPWPSTGPQGKGSAAKAVATAQAFRAGARRKLAVSII
jgi:hypothetical protein